MEYVKINSLWKRRDYVKGLPKGSHGPFLIGEYSEPEFGNIKNWRVDEKIDGANVRIIYKDGRVKFGGRTEDAHLPCNLLDYLQEIFCEGNLSKIFHSDSSNPYPTIVLFGEGYGPRIQAGSGIYSDHAGFVLFDAYVGGWWLNRESLEQIAMKLNIQITPFIGIMTEQEIIEFVKSKPQSVFTSKKKTMEGVICRSHPLMLFRKRPMISSEPLIYGDYHEPIMWKLKCKEF